MVTRAQFDRLSSRIDALAAQAKSNVGFADGSAKENLSQQHPRPARGDLTRRLVEVGHAAAAAPAAQVLSQLDCRAVLTEALDVDGMKEDAWCLQNRQIAASARSNLAGRGSRVDPEHRQAACVVHQKSISRM